MNDGIQNGVFGSMWQSQSVQDVSLKSPMELYVLEHRLEVCSIPKHAIKEFTHSLIKIAFLPDSSPEFFSFTETVEDYTVITTREHFEDLPRNEKLKKSNYPWRALTVSVGEMGATELAGVSKIAKSVICPLANEGISVLVLSTYQSDYILVQEPFLNDAIQCLANLFNIYDEYEERITSAAREEDQSLFQNIKSTKHRPVFTSLVSPDTYHITGLDSAFFPSVVQILLEMMFFSSKAKSENFFHFSMIESDISLVLDSHALSRFPSNALHTSSQNENWRMINIGDAPFDFETYGVVARVAEPLAHAGISTYYTSTYNYGHTLVYDQDLQHVLEILKQYTISDDTCDESR
eukprot:Seg38.3 transcript_id=Seg38.3/GoldUCD/mRNA.D3Y31 product="Cytosolic arginine sensor for mTORC1 subunit 1" protein_id=Seg38.3/GoldUCD/D3Y31